MAVHVFAAIDVGSYELEMKVYELSKKRGIREIDDIVHRIDLGTDTYNTGKISQTHIEELKKVLLDYGRIMENYDVESYTAYATSAFREMTNSSIVLDQIEEATGVHITVLGNSEQRFIDFKSVATKGEAFSIMLQKNTAIVDIGGGSVQISLFENGRLTATQNMKLGVLRLNEQLHRINASSSKTRGLIEELVNSQLYVFRKLYLEKRTISNMVIVDDYISEVVSKKNISTDIAKKYVAEDVQIQIPNDGYLPQEMIESGEFLSTAAFAVFTGALAEHNRMDVARALDISDENVPFLRISAIMVQRIAKAMKAELIWVPGATLCEGIVFDVAQKQRYITIEHDFDQDIITSAREISRRYNGSVERIKTLETLSLRIFDAMKKIHGMGKRERLLLQIAAILHDCGKYISMTHLAECSYSIIMNTEIIGISRLEREIIANVVKYNHSDFIYYRQQRFITDLDQEAYLTIAKLTAIIRLANGLDRSHKEKFNDLKCRIRDGQLMITVDTKKDITLEKGLFTNRADFFEEIFGIRPVIRQRRD